MVVDKCKSILSYFISHFWHISNISRIPLVIRQAPLAFVRPKAIGTFKCHCVVPINKNGVVVVWLMQAVRGCEMSKKVAGMVHSDCRHGA
jgi:hypothetical protein